MKSIKKTTDRTIEELRELNNALKPKEGEPCVYCGLLATDKEHLIPISWINEMREMKLMGFNVEVPKEIIVPACQECNLIAGALVFKGFKEKREFIREKLFKKYKKFAEVKIWRDEEIDELSGRLREQVFLFNEIVKIIKRRLNKLRKYKNSP